MPAHPIAVLQVVNGAGWAFLGAINIAAIAAGGDAPVLGWWQAALVAVVVAIALTLASARAISASTTRAEPAAGRLFAAPIQTAGHCIGPFAVAVAILVVTGVVPGGEPYRGLAALLFLAIGIAYLALALWVRRLEQRRGLIITQPVNRFGMRAGDVLALRLPR